MRSAYATRFLVFTLLLLAIPVLKANAADKAERVAVKGQVVDESGEPVAGIAVRGRTYDDVTEATSDAEGNFVLEVLESRQQQLEIVADDPERDRLGVVPAYQGHPQEGKPVAITLKPCKHLAIEVADAEGQPAEGVTVGALVGYARLIDITTGPDGKGTLRIPEGSEIQSLFAYSPKLGLDYKTARSARDKLWQPDWSVDEEIRFTLAPAKPIRVHLAEPDGEPIPNLGVYLWYVTKPDEPEEFNLGYLPEAFRLKTDTDGVAEFKIPEWNERPLTFWVDSETYVSKRIDFDPKEHADGAIKVVVDRLVSISGQVKMAGGEPQPGIEVSVTGSGAESFTESTTTDSKGHYKLKVPPNSLYMIVTGNSELVAPAVDGIVVRRGEPLTGLDLELRPATRVFGRVTVGSDEAPLKAKQLTLLQYGRSMSDLPDVDLRDDKGETIWGQPTFRRYTTTDEQGHYEFFVGPGQYALFGLTQVPAHKFEVVDEAELEINFNAPRPERGPFSGKVVTGDPPRPVPNAIIDGIYRAHVGRDFLAKTDSEGRFSEERALHRVVLRAKSEDGKLMGIVEIGPDDSEATIAIGPLGSAKGRLIDANSRAALPETEIRWGRRIHIGDDDAPWQTSWGGRVATDSEGNFTLKGLVVGQKYELSVPRGDGRYGGLPGHVCESIELVDLGDLKLEPPYVEPTFEDRVARELVSTRSPTQRYDRALAEAERLRQHVIVVFVNPIESSADNWFRLSLEDREVGRGLHNYQLVQLDVNDKLVAELAQRLGADPRLATPQWIVSSETGELLESGAVPVEAGTDKIDRAGLLERLARHAPEPLDAHEVLKGALIDAAATNRRVIVQETATWCGPCHMLARFLEKHRTVWEKDYIWIRIDHRWKGSKEVMDALQAEDRGGIPWCAILDAEGNILATSGGPEGNIGFPSEPEGIAHFTEMLNSTRQRMTERDVKILVDDLKQ